MPSTLKPIEPKAERWEQAEDPNDIVIPGLDTSGSVNDQIDQIEQLITIKLQVRRVEVRSLFIRYTEHPIHPPR